MGAIIALWGQNRHAKDRSVDTYKVKFNQGNKRVKLGMEAI